MPVGKKNQAQVDSPDKIDLVAPKDKIGSRKAITIAIACIFAMIGVQAYLILYNSSVSTDDAYLNSDITIIKPKVTGYLTEIHADDNQSVVKDQLIAKVDSRDYQLKIDQISSNIDAAKARLKILDQNLIIQTYETRKAEFDLDSAKVSFERLDKDYNRSAELLKKGSISVQAFESSEELKNTAKDKLDSIETNLKESLAREQINIAQLAESKADLASLEASLSLANLDLDYTNIRAQTDGIISRKTMQLGQLVSPSVAIAYLVQPNVWVEANFKEIQVGNMAVGQKAIIKVDAISNKTFTGKVDSISPATGAKFGLLPSENATGNFTKIVQRVPVKIVFDKDQDLSQLKPGLSSKVTVEFK